jgi:hypothetical protein
MNNGPQNGTKPRKTNNNKTHAMINGPQNGTNRRNTKNNKTHAMNNGLQNGTNRRNTKNNNPNTGNWKYHQFLHVSAPTLENRTYQNKQTMTKGVLLRQLRSDSYNVKYTDPRDNLEKLLKQTYGVPERTPLPDMLLRGAINCMILLRSKTDINYQGGKTPITEICAYANYQDDHTVSLVETVINNKGYCAMLMSKLFEHILNHSNKDPINLTVSTNNSNIRSKEINCYINAAIENNLDIIWRDYNDPPMIHFTFKKKNNHTNGIQTRTNGIQNRTNGIQKRAMYNNPRNTIWRYLKKMLPFR